MPIINISIKDKIAKATCDQTIVCKNSDYILKVDFDKEWEQYQYKTARFAFNDDVIPVIFEGNECEIPKLPNTFICGIEIRAGDIKTTTPAWVECLPTLDDKYGEIEPPTSEVYDKIMQLLEDAVEAHTELPKGGKKGQVLKKTSEKDYDTEWQDDAVLSISQELGDSEEKVVSQKVVTESLGKKINKDGDTLNGEFKLGENASLLATDEIAGFVKISDKNGAMVGLDENRNPVFLRGVDGWGLLGLHNGSVQFSPDVPIQLPFMFLGYSTRIPLDAEAVFNNNFTEEKGILFGGQLFKDSQGLRFVEEFIPFDMRSRLIYHEDDNGEEILLAPERVIISGDGVVVGDEVAWDEISDNMWIEHKHRTVYSKGKIIQWHRYKSGGEMAYELNVPDKNGTLATVEDVDSAIGDISSALDELHAYAQNLISGVV